MSPPGLQTKQMDENFIERAEQLVAAEVQNSIERARERLPKPPGFDGTCGCGHEINPKRVGLGYYLCIDCQSSKEKRRAIFDH